MKKQNADPMMRHAAIYALAVATLCMTIGCTKDGKYSPKEKISKVYGKTTTTYAHLEEGTWLTDTTIVMAKHITEQWFWDGSKLAAIAYYDTAGRVESTVKFDYDGSQLIKVYTDTRNYIAFAYDGRKVVTATTYSEGQQQSLYQFTHDGSKISKINIHFSTMSKSNATSTLPSGLENTLWQVLMPCDARQAMLPAATSGAKSSFSVSVSLTWDGKNVSKAEVESGNVSYTTTYDYDECHNPYQGFLYALVEGGETSPMSKNNVLKATITNADGTTEATTYTYAYDGKWPIARGEGRTISSSTHRSTSTETLYFEYEE